MQHLRKTLTTVLRPTNHRNHTNHHLNHPNHHQQTRNFARYIPFKPSPKPKHHTNLRTIALLKSHLSSSYLVSPLPSHGLTAAHSAALKTPHPAAKVVVVKNKLVAKALAGTQWESLGECLKGMNSLLFVKKEEAVGEVLSGVRGVLKEGKMEFNDFTGAVVEGGKVYGFKDLEVFATAPSRVEANGMVLGSVFSPSATLMAVLEGFGAGEEGAEEAGSGVGDGEVVKEGGEGSDQ